MKTVKRLLAVLAFACFANTASAALIDLTFSGTYNTNGDAAFGLTGTAVPYLYTITYDTSFTHTEFFDTGDSIGPFIAHHQFFGYSTLGIVSFDVSFGTQAWAVSDILLTDLAANGAPAHLWFDVDIGTQAPTRGIFRTREGANDLLSVGIAGPVGIGGWEIQPESNVYQFFVGQGQSANLEVHGSLINVVPAPATLVLFGLSLAALGIARRKYLIGG